MKGESIGGATVNE